MDQKFQIELQTNYCLHTLPNRFNVCFRLLTEMVWNLQTRLEVEQQSLRADLTQNQSLLRAGDEQNTKLQLALTALPNVCVECTG